MTSTKQDFTTEMQKHLDAYKDRKTTDCLAKMDKLLLVEMNDKAKGVKEKSVPPIPEVFRKQAG
ncbi:MAG: hypothetical protein AB2669_13320 [Candidatus Thiodiazotropha endolucinida]